MPLFISLAYILVYANMYKIILSVYLLSKSLLAAFASLPLGKVSPHKRTTKMFYLVFLLSVEALLEARLELLFQFRLRACGPIFILSLHNLNFFPLFSLLRSSWHAFIMLTSCNNYFLFLLQDFTMFKLCTTIAHL
jgi:hypothetical protein